MCRNVQVARPTSRESGGHGKGSYGLSGVVEED